jgi:hypothetical protein
MMTSNWREEVRATFAEAKAQLSAARAEYRRLVLERVAGYGPAKAAEMADKLAGLDDEAFEAHADYMATKVKEYKAAQGDDEEETEARKAKTPPKATDRPAPMGGTPQKVKTLGERTQADITDYMADVFGLDGWQDGDRWGVDKTDEQDEAGRGR